MWLVLAAVGCLRGRNRPRIERSRRRLRKAAAGLHRVMALRYRHHISNGDGLRMKAGSTSSQPVEKGEGLAVDRRGVIRSPERARIFMPLYQAQGNDGFFLVKDTKTFWLAVAVWLRRLGADTLAACPAGSRVTRHGRARWLWTPALRDGVWLKSLICSVIEDIDRKAENVFSADGWNRAHNRRVVLDWPCFD